MTEFSKPYGEKYRPQFHFSPPAKWMNDPNGLVYYQGEYHLFYQHNPDDIVWGPMHWGHAVSKDLMHWEHLPIALAPNEHGTIFSGSAVVDWHDTSGLFSGGHGLVAIFTHADECLETKQHRQRQSIAYSLDKGRSWRFYDENPVLADPNEPDFRDPKVFWHEDSEKWVMVLAVGTRIRFYGSPNLKEWEFLSEFTGGCTASVWECPDMFPLAVDGNPENLHWVLLVDVQDGGPTGGASPMYFIGDFDGVTFTPHKQQADNLWLDYGRDVYAGVTWSDIPAEDGRRIFIAWMNSWQYANEIPAPSWRGAMTVPRTLELRSSAQGLSVVQNPVQELESLRKGRTTIPAQAVEGRLELEQEFSECLDLELEFVANGAEEFRLQLVSGDQEATVVGYNFTTQQLFVDRRRSGEVDFSPAFAGVHQAPLVTEDGKISLRILLDKSSIEVFANGGQAAITDLIFPREGSRRINLTSEGGSTQVRKLNIYPLASVWK
ncbi:glycoside hydrolase family 32 protein [Candidatus Darwinibacter acetoxidans]|mgnify:CR=1 FL=1